MNFHGFIFDLDGTLIDSMKAWATIGESYLLWKGCTPAPGLLEVLKPMTLLQAARYFRCAYPIEETEEAIVEQIIRMMENQYRQSIPLKPFVQPFLEKSFQMGVKMCVATATDRNLAEAALERLNIRKYLCGLITCTEAGCGKDQPVIYQEALKLLGTNIEDTVIFEDALHAVKTAKAAGFNVAGVFDETMADDTEEIKAASDWYINSFDEWEM
jgi:HAD superfamily hydrolase (TIGR01509 family)